MALNVNALGGLLVLFGFIRTLIESGSSLFFLTNLVR